MNPKATTPPAGPADAHPEAPVRAGPSLRGVDLNLLVVLEALLDEAHVTRAAERLGLSQPAMSNALERCRHLFGDPLLERGKGAMRLTPRAEALRAPLRELLACTSALVRPAAPVPLATLRQTVRIVMADFPAVVVAGPLLARLGAVAPGLQLVIEPWRGAEAAADELARGRVDLAASVFPSLGASFHRRELLHEHYRVVLRAGHPALADGSALDLERWLAWPHLLVSGRGETRGALDDALALRQQSRRVGMVVPSFLMVGPLLAQSDLIALVPSRCVPQVRAAGCVDFAPPLPVEGFPLHLAWHHRRTQDAGVRHVAQELESLLADA